MGGLAEVAGHCQSVVPGIEAAGLVLVSEPSAAARLMVSAHGSLAEQGERLQVDLGEGPCAEVCRTRRAVLAGDLGVDGPARGWPVFASQALDAGIRVVFAFPVLLHGQATAVLSLYRSKPGALSGSAGHKAVAHASAAAVLLRREAHTLITREEDQTEVALIDPSLAVINQAVGFLIASSGMSTDQALARMRAHAFARHRPLADVAADIVHHRLPANDLS